MCDGITTQVDSLQKGKKRHQTQAPTKSPWPWDLHGSSWIYKQVSETRGVKAMRQRVKSKGACLHSYLEPALDSDSRERSTELTQKDESEEP